jgi:hypothetical protein
MSKIARVDILGRIAPVVARLQAQDCRAIWLAGSHATGDPGRFSDVDLGVISGSGRRGFSLEVYDGLLLSISTLSEQAMLKAFAEPAIAGAAVPGWRDAILLIDPEGCGAALKRAAEDWRWDNIAAACDAWCAAQAVTAADDVLKLANAIERHDDREASLRRNALAARLPLVMSVHRRLLYGSERNLFRVVGREMGDEWARKHAMAIVAQPAPLAEGFAAVWWLYQRVADEITPLLNEHQSAVVRLAMASRPTERI